MKTRTSPVHNDVQSPTVQLPGMKVSLFDAFVLFLLHCFWIIQSRLVNQSAMCAIMPILAESEDFMSKYQVSKTVVSAINKFIKLAEKGRENRFKMAELYYKTTCENLAARAAFREAVGYADGEFTYLYFLGSGKLIKEMADVHTYNVGLTIVGLHLSAEEQLKLYNDGLDVYIDKDTLKHKNMHTLLSTDILQVYDQNTGKRRSDSEQQAYFIKQLEASTIKVSASVAYTKTRRGTIKFKSKVELTKELLRKILTSTPRFFTSNELHMIANELED